jgi:hypothetical protein
MYLGFGWALNSKYHYNEEFANSLTVCSYVRCSISKLNS